MANGIVDFVEMAPSVPPLSYTLTSMPTMPPVLITPSYECSSPCVLLQISSVSLAMHRMLLPMLPLRSPTSFELMMRLSNGTNFVLAKPFRDTWLSLFSWLYKGTRKQLLCGKSTLLASLRILVSEAPLMRRTSTLPHLMERNIYSFDKWMIFV